jgi:hypothetical protein
MKLTKTKAILVETGLKAVPFIATMGGMAAGAIFFTSGVELPAFVQGRFLGQSLIIDVIIGGVLGCIGGFVLSFFGQMVLLQVTIVDDIHKKGHYNAQGEFIETKIKSYYTKVDVTEGERTKERYAVKQKEREEKIKKADEKDVARMREKFEKEKNKSSTNNSSAKNSKIKNPGTSGVKTGKK